MKCRCCKTTMVLTMQTFSPQNRLEKEEFQCPNCQTVCKTNISAIRGKDKEVASPENDLHAGWLIERYTNSRVEYWTGRISSQGLSYWDERAHEGVRFCRQQDAAVVLSWVFKGNGRVVEHAWMQPSKPEPLSSDDQSVVEVRARALMDGCSMPYEQALELAISESEK